MDEDPLDAEAQAKGRALSSPLRMRILRFCLHESHTNREIADEFELNPGTSLHHVRTLLENGFLAAEEPRSGRRGAVEIPYRATGTSFSTPVPNASPLLVQTFLDEIADVDADDLGIVRIGLKLGEERRKELLDRLVAVLLEYRAAGPDEDGVPISVFLALHPEKRRT
jgi:DNA-binding transcriptional ArsR family regulator